MAALRSEVQLLRQALSGLQEAVAGLQRQVQAQAPVVEAATEVAAEAHGDHSQANKKAKKAPGARLAAVHDAAGDAGQAADLSTEQSSTPPIVERQVPPEATGARAGQLGLRSDKMGASSVERHVPPETTGPLAGQLGSVRDRRWLTNELDKIDAAWRR